MLWMCCPKDRPRIYQVLKVRSLEIVIHLSIISSHTVETSDKVSQRGKKKLIRVLYVTGPQNMEESAKEGASKAGERDRRDNLNNCINTLVVL